MDFKLKFVESGPRVYTTSTSSTILETYYSLIRAILIVVLLEGVATDQLDIDDVFLGSSFLPFLMLQTCPVEPMTRASFSLLEPVPRF